MSGGEYMRLQYAIILGK